MILTDNIVPLRRPHFHLRGRQLFFLISKRPYTEFDAIDAELWENIDGTVTIAELRGQFPDVSGQIQKFWDLEIVEVAPARFEEHRKRILVIEPHMDDAVLSVGGLMWLRRNECEFTVLTVVGVSNFTSYCRIDREYFDVKTVTDLRRAESEAVMHVLGGKHRVLDQHDAPLRYQPGNCTIGWYKKNRRSISAFVNHSSPDAEVESLVESIIPALSSTDAQEIWIPLGVGTSADHEMTRNACLRALMRLPDLCQRVEMYFYQDVPYAIMFPQHTAQILDAIGSSGGMVEQVCDDVGEAMPDKLRMLSVFGSQFKPSYMDPKVVACGHQAIASDSGYGELRFRIKKLPGRVDQIDFYSGREHVRALLGRLEKWYPRHRSAKRIRILCPMGVGRWKEDMSFLLEAFPNAILEVHITDDAIDETGRFVSPRIEIRPVNGLRSAWIFRILSVILSRPRPLMVLTSVKLRKLVPFVKASCFMSDPLPATTIDHLVQALRLRISQSASGDVNCGC
jgi:LmbE family N-acetylglucosaminyl deacetylase